MTHVYYPEPGEHIAAACKKLVTLAAELGRAATMTFNGIEIRAEPGMAAEAALAAYDTEMARLRAQADEKRRAFEQTPKGQEQLRKAEERRLYLATEVAKGALPFTRSDETLWAECVAKNDDPYGACAIRYAARWANLMESAIARGAELKAVAKEKSNDADIEGITGFMYGCAVSILARCWKHVEELRRWHNVDTQIGTEGERANESGGTLNPALLRVGESQKGI